MLQNSSTNTNDQVTEGLSLLVQQNALTVQLGYFDHLVGQNESDQDYSVDQLAIWVSDDDLVARNTGMSLLQCNSIYTVISG